MGADPITAALISAGGGIISGLAGSKQKGTEIPGTQWKQTLPPEAQDQLKAALASLQGIDVNQLLAEYAQPYTGELSAAVPNQLGQIGNWLMTQPQVNTNNQYTTDAAAAYQNMMNTQAANIYDPNSPEGIARQRNIDATRARTQEDIDLNTARARERFALQGGLYGGPVGDTIGRIAEGAITKMEQALSQQDLAQQNFAQDMAQRARQFGTQGMAGLGGERTQADLYNQLNQANRMGQAGDIYGSIYDAQQRALDRQYADAIGAKEIGLGLETRMPFDLYDAAAKYAEMLRWQPGTASQKVYPATNPWSDAFSQFVYQAGQNNWFGGGDNQNAQNPRDQYTGTFSSDLPLRWWEL